MSSDEARLIQQAKERDPAAFAEIYDRYQPPIYRYIFHRVDDVATAEDLTGEVFARLVERIDHFTYRGRPLLTWLYTLARNLFADYRRQAQQASMLPLDEQLVAETDELEQATERELAQRRMAAALPYLTEDQRQVIILKFIKGLDNAEVALTLGKSVGAVKSLQYRAMAALRRILERNGEGITP